MIQAPGLQAWTGFWQTWAHVGSAAVPPSVVTLKITVKDDGHFRVSTDISLQSKQPIPCCS